jgi:hypothetical protein
MLANQLQNLSERELLILVCERIENINDTMGDTVKQVHEIDMRVRELEIKIKVWAAIIGSGSGIVTHFIIQLLSK